MGQKEDSERLRELEVLEALVENPEARQADLATRLGVAVGTVNWLLKRLVSKGYVKVKRIGRWRWRYLVRQAKPGRSCGLGGVHHVNSLFDM